MCLNVIRVSIELRNFAQVANYVTKAEQNLPSEGGDPTTPANQNVSNNMPIIYLTTTTHRPGLPDDAGHLHRRPRGGVEAHDRRGARQGRVHLLAALARRPGLAQQLPAEQRPAGLGV